MIPNEYFPRIAAIAAKTILDEHTTKSIRKEKLGPWAHSYHASKNKSKYIISFCFYCERNKTTKKHKNKKKNILLHCCIMNTKQKWKLRNLLIGQLSMIQNLIVTF